jgi:hypothetical protein
MEEKLILRKSRFKKRPNLMCMCSDQLYMYCIKRTHYHPKSINISFESYENTDVECVPKSIFIKYLQISLMYLPVVCVKNPAFMGGNV